MNRFLISSLLTLALGVAIGYACGYSKEKRAYENLSKTLFLHSDLNTADLTGRELVYLKDPQSGKAALSMRLHFCGAVEDANEWISKGAMPFPFHIDTTGLEQGRETMKGYQATKCVASVGELIDAIPKLQSRYNK